MKANYSIKNFRAFDKEGATFDICPITILTGCNSSGKSSFVKSLLALDNYLAAVRSELPNGLNPSRIALQFASNAQLGGIQSVLNKAEDSDGLIKYTYAIESKLAGRKLRAELSFGSCNNNVLGNGYLKELRISTMDEEEILLARPKSGDENEMEVIHINFNPLKDSFIKYSFFLIGVKLVSILNGYECTGEGMTQDELANLKSHIKEWKKMRLEFISDEELELFKEAKYEGMSAVWEKTCPSIADLKKKQSIFAGLGICEEFQHLAKAEVRKKLEEIATEIGSDKLSFFLNAILTDFEKSSCESLSDYVRTREDSEAYDYVNGTVSWNPGIRNRFDMITDIENINKISYQDIAWYMVEDGAIEVKLTAEDETGIIYDDTKEDNIESDAKTFSTLVEVLMKCSDYYAEKEASGVKQDEYNDYRYRSFENDDMFRKYTADVIKELVGTQFTGPLSYVSSSRATVKRLYSIDEKGDAFDELLKKYFEIRRTYRGNFTPGSFINKWLKAFEIGESLTFEPAAEGLGILIYLHKEGEIEPRLLADEGYGITQLLSILINIEMQIMAAIPSKKSKIKWIAEPNYKFDFIASTIAVEEPEIHLHPRFQSMLATMFLEAYRNYNIHFIIETHSEYLIRKFQAFVAQSSLQANTGISADEISIYYLNNPKKRPEGKNHVERIVIKPDGRLSNPFGPGFFDEADSLAMSLLKIKLGNYGNA